MSTRAAYAWAKDYALSALIWAATIAAPIDQELFASGSLRPVVVVPGSGENWRFLRPLIARVHEAGHPVRVLPEWQLPAADVHAVFPTRSHLSAKTRALIDALLVDFAPHRASLDGSW